MQTDKPANLIIKLKKQLADNENTFTYVSSLCVILFCSFCNCLFGSFMCLSLLLLMLYLAYLLLELVNYEKEWRHCISLLPCLWQHQEEYRLIKEILNYRPSIFLSSGLIWRFVDIGSIIFHKINVKNYLVWYFHIYLLNLRLGTLFLFLYTEFFSEN